MPRATWWVKFRRAEKHLRELNAEWTRARDDPRPYSAVYEIQAAPQGYWLHVWADIIDPVKDDFAAIVGDLVFNLRSALDHITCAVTGRDDAQFPIFEPDIWGSVDIGPDGKDRNKQRRRAFRENIRGMPPAALAIYKGVQPYERLPRFPENDLLALLNRLSNGDKHRTLTAMAQYLYSPRTRLRFPPSGIYSSGYDRLTEEPGRLFQNHAIVATWGPFLEEPASVQVESEGGIEIGLQEVHTPNFNWGLPGTPVAIKNHVGDILKEIEPHIP